jgi:hypothetical protein
MLLEDRRMVLTALGVAEHAADETLHFGRETTWRVRFVLHGRGHSDVYLAAGGGTFGHKDVPKQDATPRDQGEGSLMQWKTDKFRRRPFY